MTYGMIAAWIFQHRRSESCAELFAIQNRGGKDLPTVLQFSTLVPCSTCLALLLAKPGQPVYQELLKQDFGAKWRWQILSNKNLKFQISWLGWLMIRSVTDAVG